MVGCTTLGPDYEEPRVEWLQDWQPELYPMGDDLNRQSDLDLSFWWHLFDDPVLNGLIATAKQENPGLRLAGLRILESRAALGIAGSALYPQVQQATGAINYVGSREFGGQADGETQSFVGYQAGLNAAWELDFWGKFKRGIESADAAFFASMANQRDVQVLLSAQVADLYFAFHTILLKIDLARRNADIQKRSLNITEIRFKHGQDSELDVQQAKTQYLATESTIPELEIALVEIRNALTILLNRPPGDLPELAGLEGYLPTLPIPVDSRVPASLLLRRPDVRTAAWQVATQSAQIGVAKADYYPSIALLGSIGWSGTSLSGSSDTGSFSLGPAVQWNIFDYGRIKNNVRLQDARLQQAIVGFQSTVLGAAREVDDAAVNVIKTDERRKPLSASVDAANRSLDLAQTRYREGYSDFQRVLDAQRALFSQAERLLDNEGNHIGSIIAFYKALGGGWEAMSIDEMIPVETRDIMESRTDWGDLLTAPLPATPTSITPPSDTNEST